MTRAEEIREAAFKYAAKEYRRCCDEDKAISRKDFIAGAEWADAHPRSPWISVEDRLPDKINKFMSETVLCRYTRGGKEYYHVTQYDFDYNQWMIGNVTHWMPIPGL